MAIYEVNGQQYEVPDDMPEDQVIQMITQDQQGQASTSTPTAPATPPSTRINPDTLQFNQEWLDASWEIYKLHNGPNAKQLSAKELSDWGLDQISFVKYNLLRGLGPEVAKIQNATPEQKKALLHLLDTSDNLEYTWSGTGRAVRHALTDPLNYVGLTTLGFGFVGSQAAKLASKEALRSMLKASLVPAIEGSVYGAVQNRLEQEIRIQGGGQEGVNYGQLAVGAGVGAAAGGVLGAGVDAARIGIRGARGGQAVPEPTVGATQAPEAPTGAVEVQITTATPGLTPPAVPEPTATPAITPSTNPTADTILDSVRRNATISNTLEGMQKASKETADLLVSLPGRDASQVIQTLKANANTEQERVVLNSALLHAFDVQDAKAARLHAEAVATTDVTEQHRLLQLRSEAEAVRDAIKEGDLFPSSNTGRSLGERRGHMNTGEYRNLSEDSILAEKGLVNPAKKEEGSTLMDATPDQIAEAKAEFYTLRDKFVQKHEADEDVVRLAREIETAKEQGDFAKAAALNEERHALLDIKVDETLEKSGIAAQTNTGIRKFNEYLISTVFTPGTLLINFLPTALKVYSRPMIDAIVKGGPFDQAGWAQMMASYSAMHAQVGTALRKAKLAFDYERTFTGVEGHNKILEQDPQIEGLKGRVIRMFPRLLNATDQFFADVSYAGFIQGERAAAAMEQGIKLGKTGDDLAAFVTEQVQKSADEMFKPMEAVTVMDLLRKQGVSRGLTGDDLTNWMQHELQVRGDLFEEATSQIGKNFADDMNFKKQFSGEGFASGAAKRYEEWVNQNPILRPLGQLFMRTPVRVFEEGLRLTPGLNLVTPNFLADLAGKNGTQAQAKAHGQAMLSFAIGQYVVMEYALGNLKGAGAGDWKEKRTREATGEWQPYTWGGFNYRNMDPYFTSVKIIANAMDQIMALEYRKAQGDYVDKEQKELVAMIGVAMMPVVQSIKDASLMEGVGSIVELFEAMKDPERNENKWTRFFGEKTNLLVPNVARKGLQWDNPYINDPASLGQYVENIFTPTSETLSRRYNALGIPVMHPDPLRGLVGIGFVDGEVYENLNEKQAAVLRELANIARATGQTFIPPAKASTPGLHGVDLRSELTADKRTTLMNRWMEIYSSMPVADALYDALIVKGANLPYGTRGPDMHGPGTKTGVASQIINAYRGAALKQLQQEDFELRQRIPQHYQDFEKAVRGQREAPSFNPFPENIERN